MVGPERGLGGLQHRWMGLKGGQKGYSVDERVCEGAGRASVDGKVSAGTVMVTAWM